MFRYYCPMRPPMIGGIPKDGLQETYCFRSRETVPDCWRPVWGWADYNRPLTEKEIDDYELIPAGKKLEG